jgi:hypothetical protein
MNAAQIRNVLSFIPERQSQPQSGCSFALEGSTCRYPERLAHLAPLLNWLTPLNPITLEDQHVLGLVGANGRPLHACDEEDLELAAEDAEEGAEVAQAAEAREVEPVEEPLAL